MRMLRNVNMSTVLIFPLQIRKTRRRRKKSSMVRQRFEIELN